MAPEPKWDVGNGNDPYGPGPILLPPGYQEMMDRINPDHNPTSQPEHAIYEDAGRLNGFNADKAGPRGRRQPKNVALAHITTFEQGYTGIIGAADDPAPGQHAEWGDAGGHLDTAATTLETISPSDGIKGATANAILEKVAELRRSVEATAAGAHRMDNLVDMFSRDISRTKEWFETGKLIYDMLPKGADGKPEASSDLDMLNVAAQDTIRGSYNPPIDMIGYNHPDLPPAPQAGGTPTPPATTSPNLGGGSGGPGGIPPGGLGMPTMPAVTDPAASQPSTASPASALGGLSNAAKGAGDAAQKAAQGAKQAGQNAAKAAQGALGNLLNGKKGPGGLPEGALALGPKNPTGATKAGGAGGARGGAGTPGRAAPSTKPTAQVSPVSKASAAPASRAGISSSAGSPGGGAPAAGHRGGGGADKVHKASKALRHNNHGMLEEGDAVVQVVGDDAKSAEPPKPT